MRNQIRFFQIIVLLVVLVFSQIFIATPVDAQQLEKTGFEDICSKARPLADCIQKIYLFSLGFGALIALLMIILAGYRYMTAQGNSQAVESAKDAFASAFIGLIIIFVAFILLYVINPDLVRFKKGI